MTHAADGVLLHHVIVVGGTPGEWAAVDDDRWSTVLCELGKVADQAGASWLVLRPYGPTDTAPGGQRRTVQVGRCTVVADPAADGRARLAAAVQSLQAATSAITEEALDRLLHAPAEVDPDLVVVLGPPGRMPPSLVWELAYSELVFVGVEWAHFDAEQLETAIATFTRRHRRFGGVDD